MANTFNNSYQPSNFNYYTGYSNGGSGAFSSASSLPKKCSCGGVIEQTWADPKTLGTLPNLCPRCIESLKELTECKIVSKGGKHVAKIEKRFTCKMCNGIHMITEITPHTENPLTNYICDTCYSNIKNDKKECICPNCLNHWTLTAVQQEIIKMNGGDIMCDACIKQYEKLKADATIKNSNKKLQKYREEAGDQKKLADYYEKLAPQKNPTPNKDVENELEKLKNIVYKEMERYTEKD